MAQHILIVDDDEEIAAELSRVVRAAGFECKVVIDVASALAELTAGPVDVVLLDLGLPGEEGLSPVERVVRAGSSARIVVLTGRDEASLAIGALRAGASDYLVKPWKRDVLLAALRRAAGATAPVQPKEKARPRQGSSPDLLFGSSPTFRAVIDQARLAAESPRVPVLLTGECGTGKDVVGHQVHLWSPRSTGPFVSVNAACLPATLLESELFGHEAGAFTDARGTRRGLFEQAHGGTLFLDEIGELPIELQPKLLRVLEGHPFRRLGGEREISVDVRLVAATNRRLPEMIAQGRFREDLYYRLSVFELQLPPLRERSSDIAEFARHFLESSSRDMDRPVPEILPRAMEQLLAHPWPGNVRELRNVIERAVVLSRGEAIDLVHLPVEVRGAPPRRASELPMASDLLPLLPRQPPTSDELSLEAATRVHVLKVFELTSRNLTRAASLLGITRVSLRKKLKAYGIYPVQN